LILDDVIPFGIIMFAYVLPAILMLITVMWLRDWIVRIAKRMQKTATEKIEEMKKDRWLVILEMMKIVMFLVLLFPLLAVINYATNEGTDDPGEVIFTETMPYVWIVVTAWYLFAIVIYGVYLRNRQDIEMDAEKELRRQELG